MEKLISVIVPAYNAESQIDICLVSLLNQTYKNLEIICINDCSTDNTQEKILSYARTDKRIKLINNEINMGLSRTRNRGIAAAQGEYIAFVDSDDFVDTTYYERLYHTLIEKNADVVSTTVKVTWKNKFKLWCNFCGEYTRFAQKVNAVYRGCCWNKLYKKEIITRYQITFPENLLLEDNLFVIKYLAYCNKLIIINDVMYHYIMNDSSIMNDVEKEEKRKQAALTISAMLMEFIKQTHPKDKRIIRSFILHNLVKLHYLNDKKYYNELKKITGTSWDLFNQRAKAIKKQLFNKIKQIHKVKS